MVRASMKAVSRPATVVCVQRYGYTAVLNTDRACAVRVTPQCELQHSTDATVCLP